MYSMYSGTVIYYKLRFEYTKCTMYRRIKLAGVNILSHMKYVVKGQQNHMDQDSRTTTKKKN